MNQATSSSDVTRLPNAQNWQRIKQLERKVERLRLGKRKNEAEYWWNLYVIYRDKLWVDSGYKNTAAWELGMERKRGGPNHATLRAVIRAIEEYKIIGFTEEEIKWLLSHYKNALVLDLNRLFARVGSREKPEYKLKPEAEQLMTEMDGSPKEFIRRIAPLSSRDATRIMRGVTIPGGGHEWHCSLPLDISEGVGRVGVSLLKDGITEMKGTMEIRFVRTHPDIKAGIPDEYVNALKHLLRLER